MDLGSSGRGGGKKSLDAVINLVPFIDLMAVTISFLLLTAVWTDVGRLEVSSAGQTVSETAPPPDAPLVIHVAEGKLELNAVPVRIDSLASKLREAKGPTQTTVTLRADDVVRYDELVKVIDTCIGAGLPNVSVEPAT